MDMRPQHHATPGTTEPLQDPSAPASHQDQFTPLEHLVHLLQGSTEPSIADAGITALPAPQLDTICVTARQEADNCQERADLLLDLLESSLEHGNAPAMDTQLRIARQLRQLGRDQRRWSDLNDNASYYRDNPHVAMRIAAWCRQHPTGPKAAPPS